MSSRKDQEQHLLELARRDRIYATAESYSFAFGSEVAEVFDDMISRSVPYYLDLQLLSVSTAVKFYQENTALYDLGCATGTTLSLIAKRLPAASPLVGVDSSESMLEQANEKLGRLGVRSRVVLRNERLQSTQFLSASAVFCHYTLQFIKQSERPALLKKIYDALVPGGVLLISEKNSDPEGEEGAVVRTLHEDFKSQNGYTASEIARKRESLSGVMLPFSEGENISMFQEAGFREVTCLMRGYQFCTWLCRK